MSVGNYMLHGHGYNTAHEGLSETGDGPILLCPVIFLECPIYGPICIQHGRYAFNTAYILEYPCFVGVVFFSPSFPFVFLTPSSFPGFKKKLFRWKLDDGPL